LGVDRWLELPRENVWVEEVPVVPRSHADAAVLSALDEAFSCESFDGFADDGSASAELLLELSFAHRSIAWLELTFDDPQAQVANDVTLEAAGGEARHKSDNLTFLEQVKWLQRSEAESVYDCAASDRTTRAQPGLCNRQGGGH
jgi:hypothetical protein